MNFQASLVTTADIEDLTGVLLLLLIYDLILYVPVNNFAVICCDSAGIPGLNQY